MFYEALNYDSIYDAELNEKTELLDYSKYTIYDDTKEHIVLDIKFCNKVLFFNIIPMLTTTLIAYIVGFLYMGINHTHVTCDNTDTFMSMSTWLIVYGSVELFALLLGLVVMLIIFNIKSDNMVGYIYKCFPYLFLLHLAWKMMWNIVGITLLLGYNIECMSKLPILWGCTLTVWILDIIYITVIIICKQFTNILN